MTYFDKTKPAAKRRIVVLLHDETIKRLKEISYKEDTARTRIIAHFIDKGIESYEDYYGKD